MKKLSNNLFTQMSTEQLRNLTSVVNETLATGFYHSSGKLFTAADLWNIQRQGKNRTKRRISL